MIVECAVALIDGQLAPMMQLQVEMPQDDGTRATLALNVPTGHVRAGLFLTVMTPPGYVPHDVIAVPAEAVKNLLALKQSALEILAGNARPASVQVDCTVDKPTTVTASYPPPEVAE